MSLQTLWQILRGGEMAQEQTAVIKGCKSCAFLANGNYGSCRDIMSSNGQSCFGSRKEIANNSGKYLYRKWKSKYDKTPMAELKYQAYCDIVLEGSVKAGVKLYISSENLPSTTFDNLYLVCENCGYLMYKGNWTDSI